jgi:hypothetical protein
MSEATNGRFAPGADMPVNGSFAPIVLKNSIALLELRILDAERV